MHNMTFTFDLRYGVIKLFSLVTLNSRKNGLLDSNAILDNWVSVPCTIKDKNEQKEKGRKEKVI